MRDMEIEAGKADKVGGVTCGGVISWRVPTRGPRSQAWIYLTPKDAMRGMMGGMLRVGCEV